jgi:heme/copper-type cytochrome/quinol oxidase subunit 2
MRPSHARVLLLAAVACVVAPHVACADADDLVFAIRAQDGHFQPSELRVPANRPFTLHVTSAEKTPIEFESFELHRERVVQPGGTIRVLMPALAPGTYKFFDDFHRDTPEGSIVVE